MASGEFSRLLVSHWRELHEKLRAQDEEIVIDGRSLSLAAVIASARYGQYAAVSEEMLEIIDQNTERIYGKFQDSEVPATPGLSAGSQNVAKIRLNAPNVEQIQRNMVRDLHFGVLAGETEFDNSHAMRTFSSSIPLNDPVESTSMPESWVRASIIIRANSLTYSASGIRPVLLQQLLQILNFDIIPRVPLRGSISASGDLSPLSYISAVLQGKPAVQAWIGDRIQGGRKLVPADEALNYAEIPAIDIRAKEGLAMITGTAFSAGVAALALHETICLAATSQVLTAMSVEALCGSSTSFHSLFSDLRPHPGQTECAANIQSFIHGSKLILENTGQDEVIARQDRYSIRTAPQWIGPILEDLLLAHSQISLEINSATDNPLIDPAGNMLHGGNFQAKSVTSAMEKVRQGCQSLGQILFTQCTELVNPASNRGLAPNLVVDEPTASGLWKGTDILIASLQSELGFLANPVGSHVQYAEMGFQAINSLALVSGRYTLTAVDILTQLAAAHLVALCQALDLRALHIQFQYALAPKFKKLTRRCLSECIEPITPGSGGGGAEIAYDLWVNLNEHLNRTTEMDSAARFQNAMDNLQSRLLREVPQTQASLEAVQQWNSDCVNEAIQTYQSVRARYLATPNATPMLGKAAKKMYLYLRQTLEIPFFGTEYLGMAEWDDGTSHTSKFKYRSMGAMISAVYEAMRNGALYGAVIECFGDV
ncbi:phenylalanine ammonia-lyase-like protein [Corynespora cassiicola Philippines]|uniref:Phenylalanine ammonia-lyase-like protein n=1 Tax=Corynespora cassiicola Philippines TaxID=1448308 RepID=A0A2T2NVF3_CORCC|nr:phenylalanine ammonia-lyase-like protein [Corynespora cassiicola Philippines]